MRVFYDDEIFFRQRFGGVSRIFTELIRALKNDSRHQLLFCCYYSENEYLIKLFPAISSFFKEVNFPFKGKLVRALYGNYSHAKTNKLLLQNKADVFHPTFYTDYYLDSIKRSKTRLVFTVHDLIHEQAVNNRHYAEIAKMKKANIEVADQIIVVSEHTKKDLLKFYPFVDEAKINIIPLAQSLPEQGIKPDHLPDRYILFTGERSGYKNFEKILIAFSEINKTDRSLHLFCAGSRAFGNEEKALIKQLNVDQLVLQKQLTDAELKYTYQHAQLFVFPSLYEGFGIPVLEAFASGTPVVLSDRTSLPEVGGDAALYADCTDVTNIKEAILTLLTNGALKKELVEKGHKRAAGFNWKIHVDAALEVYKKALQ